MGDLPAARLILEFQLTREKRRPRTGAALFDHGLMFELTSWSNWAIPNLVAS